MSAEKFVLRLDRTTVIFRSICFCLKKLHVIFLNYELIVPQYSGLHERLNVVVQAFNPGTLGGGRETGTSLSLRPASSTG